MTTPPRFAHVRLRGETIDGNLFGVVCAARAALEKAGVGNAELEAFVERAFRGDYDHGLRTVGAMVAVAWKPRKVASSGTLERQSTMVDACLRGRVSGEGPRDQPRTA